MEDLNSVFLIGRLTRDVELRYTNSNIAVIEIPLAVNRRVKSGDGWADEASFFDVKYFGRGAEAIAKYLNKGKRIGVLGALNQERWKAQDGTNRSKVVVIADSVQLLDGGGGKSGNAADGEMSSVPF